MTRELIIEHCSEIFAKWQLPDDVVFVEEIPLTSTGKIDKKGDSWASWKRTATSCQIFANPRLNAAERQSLAISQERNMALMTLASLR